MGCLRCGKEAMDGSYFCEECLVGMKRYPVKPGTAVHLRTQKQETQPKKVRIRRKAIKPEEQLGWLKQLLKRLLLVILILVAVIAVLIILLVAAWQKEPVAEKPAQNVLLSAQEDCFT